MKEKDTYEIDEILDELEEEKKLRIESNEWINYFDNFKEMEFDSIDKLSEEMHFTLKQFLYEDCLYAAQIVKMLKETEFKAAQNNVQEKLDKLYKLRLIQDTLPTQFPETKTKLPERYFKLTSIGLFYLLKEIKLDERVYPFELPRIKIFKTYGNDFLFQNLIYNLIDKELLCSITDDNILGRIFEFLQKICKEIYKELGIFMKFYKNGKIEEECKRWNFYLKNDKTKWSEFCKHLLWQIDIPFGRRLNLDPIVDCNITSNHISFRCNNRKYLIEIDEQNKKAKLLINDKEHVDFTIEKTKYCFILYKVKYADKNEFLNSMLIRFERNIEQLQFQFGLSILNLFDIMDVVVSTVAGTHYDMLKLAKDEKIKLLLGQINDKLNENYNQFRKCSK